MKRFLQRHADQVSGVSSGFDRLRFRGTMRWLAYADGMRSFLSCVGVLLKDFQTYVQGVTDRIRSAAEELARAERRPLLYLNSSAISKEETARKIAERDGVRDGLICIFSAVEPCFSYEVHRSRERRLLELRGPPQKRLHYYFYFQDPTFGFMHVRLQTWFPLNVHVAVNGREWLARQLDAAGIGSRRQDNCLLEAEDLRRAQQLADAQLKTRWNEVFDKLIDRVHPVHRQLVWRGESLSYDWSLEQSEWASDVMFRSTEDLAALYPSLLRRGLDDFSSPEVMRDLRPLLFGAEPVAAEEARRQGAKVTRQLRLLRAHGLILKVPRTHRYQLTVRGRTILTTLQAARQANAEQLAKLAA